MIAAKTQDNWRLPFHIDSRYRPHAHDCVAGKADQHNTIAAAVSFLPVQQRDFRAHLKRTSECQPPLDFYWPQVYSDEAACDILPRMRAPDLDVHREAKLYLDRYGDQAVSEARIIVTARQAAGDGDGADHWLQLIAVLEELQRAAARSPQSG